MDQPLCTIQQLEIGDTLLMCAIGGLTALLFVLLAWGLVELGIRFRERRLRALDARAKP